MQRHLEKILKDYVAKRKLRLSKEERRVFRSLIKRTSISRDIGVEMDDRSFGERVADQVAAFGGSWTFIFIFAGILLAWVILNSFVLARRGEAFDPYPYILLNLFLSMLAALQAPVIMMSQNRQSAKDRLAAEHDYEVNLKSELEIRFLHEKLDELREQRWSELVEMQQKQIEMLTKLLSEKEISPEEDAKNNVIEFAQRG